MQRAAFEALTDFSNGARRVVVIGEVDLDVILRSRAPRALLRERVARTGDDAPARRGEADHGRMTDAPAGPGQQQRSSWSLIGWSGHGLVSPSSFRDGPRTRTGTRISGFVASHRPGTT